MNSLKNIKIKYIYQLFISHFSIIFIAFLILSILFGHYVENLVYKNKVSELTSYGESILREFEQSKREQSLSQYRRFLNEQNTYFSIFDSRGRIVYPLATASSHMKITEEDWDKLSNGQNVVVKQNIQWASQDVSLVAIPSLSNGDINGGILLISPISGSREMISELNQSLFYTILIALFVSLLLSWLLSKVHVNRIEKIRRATSKIAKGNYDAHIETGNLDEIDEMANDFNNMVDQLKLSNEEIVRLENRRRQFMADVSHELRTPLTTISGVIEGMRNNMIPEEEKEKGIQLVSDETKRLIRLVNENLDYERIRSNQITLMKETVQLKELFEIMNEHLIMEAKNKHNTIQLDVDEECEVQVDYDRFIQILINITKNSIQFTENGTIWLRGKQTLTNTVIEIEDTGIGIDPSEIESIWSRFYKADLSRTSNQFGEFGLGLSIVKRLVELHDGTIDVKSQKGKGTIFRIILPK
ncbi:sensor histidine kinase [Metabacillus sp. HB246100]|uniref:sensor histidine kinase n=1 Tax=Bacillus weihaiensis TaxID=1547283 RepID=UPI0023553097|nr:HAMP domain-containing sensor histidine kinase [Bacillus weihaiensis]